MTRRTRKKLDWLPPERPEPGTASQLPVTDRRCACCEASAAIDLRIGTIAWAYSFCLCRACRAKLAKSLAKVLG